jgi:hypothetical protein
MGNQGPWFNEPTRTGIRASRPLDRGWAVEIGHLGGFNIFGRLWAAPLSPTIVWSLETRRARVLGGLGSPERARANEGNPTNLVVGLRP